MNYFEGCKNFTYKKFVSDYFNFNRARKKAVSKHFRMTMPQLRAALSAVFKAGGVQGVNAYLDKYCPEHLHSSKVPNPVDYGIINKTTHDERIFVGSNN